MAATARMQHELTARCTAQIDKTDDMLEKFRLVCLSRGCNGINSFGRLFRILDKDDDMSLDFQEFSTAVKSQAPDLGISDIKILYDRFDSGGTGVITYDEFIQALRPPMSKSRVNLIRKAYNKLDRNNDGIITVDDLHGVYDASHHKKYRSGEYTEDDVFLEFLATFETPNDADGVVEWDEFLNYYSGVSACIDSDVYFDLMMRQAWKL